MHPTLSYYLAQARTADLSHRAQRHILTRAARSRGRRRRPGQRPWVLRWLPLVPGTAQPATAGARSLSPGARCLRDEN